MGDELWDDATVTGAHARAIGVEDPEDPPVQPFRAVEGHRRGFGEPLRLVVHAAGTNRVHMAPVRLGLRVLLRVAVDLAGGGQDVSRPVRTGQLEGEQGPHGIHLERVDGVPHVIFGAGR